MANSEDAFLTMRDDEMELVFVKDFMTFGSRIGVSTTFALLRHASDDEVERKRLAASILLHSYIALEDFAILLRAMMRRKKGTYLHLAMSEGEPGGTTQYPAILKKPVTAREVFDELGFDTVTVERLQRIGYEATETRLNESFGDFSMSIKQLAEYVSEYNSLKNRLKHGKGVFGVAFGLAANGCVAHLEVEEDRTKVKPDAASIATGEGVIAATKNLNVGFVRTSAEDEQARTAAIFIAKLVKMSLDLLALFVAHYHGESNAEKVALLAKSHFEGVVAAAKSLGLRSKGLTY